MREITYEEIVKEIGYIHQADLSKEEFIELLKDRSNVGGKWSES